MLGNVIAVIAEGNFPNVIWLRRRLQYQPGWLQNRPAFVRHAMKVKNKFHKEMTALKGGIRIYKCMHIIYSCTPKGFSNNISEHLCVKIFIFKV